MSSLPLIERAREDGVTFVLSGFAPPTTDDRLYEITPAEPESLIPLIGCRAGHWVVGETLVNKRFKPRLFAEYNYASGDRNSKDGTRGTFDQLYPTGHDKYGLADQVGWKNIRNARAGLDLKLARKWGLTGRYDAWWLADPHDALYNAAGNVVARNSAGTAGRFVGQEVDSVLAYTFSKYLQVSGGYGHIFPGTFLNHTTPGESYNFPYVSSTLVF